MKGPAFGRRAAAGGPRGPRDAGFVPLSTDLVPRSVVVVRLARRARRVAVVSTVATVVAALALGGWTAMGVAEERTARDTELDEADALLAVRSGFVELVALDGELSRMRAVERAAMDRDVSWSGLVEAAFVALAAVAELSGSGVEPRASVVIDAVDPDGDLFAGEDVLGLPGIGRLRMDVKTSTLPDAGLWAAALGEVDGLVDVRITTAALEADGDEPPFYRSSVSITVTAAAQSCRWHDEVQEAVQDDPPEGTASQGVADGTGGCGG